MVLGNKSSQDTGAAFLWVFVGQIARQLSSFIIGIVLARLLSPTEFGIIATANIFIAVTYAFVDSGFASALIQKKDCTLKDYSTVFYFNLIVSILFYIIIFLLSKTIADFFNNSELIGIIRVLGVLIILYAFSSIQITILKKSLNFKVQSKILVTSSFVSGIIGIIFAVLGFGVWSLVIQAVLNQVIVVIFYWYKSSWRPALVFSLNSLKTLFAFGSKLLISGIIFQIYNNLSSLIIAKFYSLAELGFYNRALRFQQLGSQQISKIVSEVTFPLFSKFQDNIDKLLDVVRNSVSTVLYFSTPLSIGMFLLSKSIILGVLGAKWSESIVFLELLSIYGVFYPFAPIFTNAIMAIGKSNEFLKLEIFRRVLDIGVLFVGAFIGINEMVWAMIVVIIISTIYSFHLMSKFVGYTYSLLFYDLKNTLIITVSISTLSFISRSALDNSINHIYILLITFMLSISFFVIVSEVIKAKEYMLVRNFLIKKAFPKFNIK